MIFGQEKKHEVIEETLRASDYELVERKQSKIDHTHSYRETVGMDCPNCQCRLKYPDHGESIECSCGLKATRFGNALRCKIERKDILRK